MPWTYLLSTSGNEDFWISRFPGTFNDVTAFAKHTVTVRRYRRIQRSGNLAVNISSGKGSSQRSKSDSDVRAEWVSWRLTHAPFSCTGTPNVIDLGEIS
jgi:hypothetical protein